MASPLDICNMALAIIGEAPIDESVDPPNLVGVDNKTVLCNLLWEPKRDALLEMHPWRFATRMVYLDHEDQIKDITGATQADPVVATSAAHGFRDYKNVYIYDVEGMTEINDLTHRIYSVATNTFSLEDVDGSAYDAYTSGGKCRLRPPFKYEYEYYMPSDLLVPWDLYDSSGKWEYKDGGLLTDDDEIYLEYIAQITDSTRYNPLFVLALANYMAVELAQRVADSKILAQKAKDWFNQSIFEAMQKEAIKGEPPTNPPDTAWQEKGRS